MDTEIDFMLDNALTEEDRKEILMIDPIRKENMTPTYSECLSCNQIIPVERMASGNLCKICIRSIFEKSCPCGQQIEPSWTYCAWCGNKNDN